jgi:hypothetical protein
MAMILQLVLFAAICVGFGVELGHGGYSAWAVLAFIITAVVAVQLGYALVTLVQLLR